MTGRQIESALEASKLVKKYSRAVVVWGGKQASQAPEITLTHPMVDVIVIGEGEITAKELLDAYENNKPFDNIKGIS